MKYLLKFLAISLAAAAAACGSSGGSEEPADTGTTFNFDIVGADAGADVSDEPDIPMEEDLGTQPDQEPAWTLDSQVPQTGVVGKTMRFFSGYEVDGEHRVYFCGDGGVFRVREAGGPGWVNRDLNSSDKINHCRAIQANDGGEQFVAVGDTGKVWRWAGTSWTNEDLITEAPNLRGVWVGRSGRIRIVGTSGTIYRLEQTWVSEAPADLEGSINAIWGVDDDTLYATGEDALLRYDSGAWVREAVPDDPLGTPANKKGFGGRAIWAAADGRVWAVGESLNSGGQPLGKVVARAPDGTWSYQDAQWEATSFAVVWGLSSTDVLAAALKGITRRFDGTEWQLVTPDTPDFTPDGDPWPAQLKVPTGTFNYVGVYASGPEDIFMFTADARMIRYGRDYIL